MRTSTKLLSLTLAFVVTGLFFGLDSAQAQDKKKKKMKSPPAEANLSLENGTTISIDYHSPAVRERDVWGDLVPYGKIWRTGANNATTFEVNKDIKVEGKTLAAGKYALFTIPDKGEWTVIFNNEAEQWGAYKYDQTKDALQVKVTPQENDNHVENMTFKMKAKGDDAQVWLLWEKLKVPILIQSN